MSAASGKAVTPTQTVEAREALDQVKGRMEGQTYYSYFFHHITPMHSPGPPHHHQGLSTTKKGYNQSLLTPFWLDWEYDGVSRCDKYEEAGLGDLWRHKTVCFLKPAYLGQQVEVEVQGQSRFSWGLMTGSAVLFHDHMLYFWMFVTPVSTPQTGWPP